MPEPASLLHEFARGKGLNTFDEDEAERAFEMKGRHELIVNIEHCIAHRPSDHLRGSSRKYTDCLQLVSSALQPSAGDGQFVLRVNDEGTGSMSSSFASSGRSGGASPLKRRPASAPRSPSKKFTAQPRVDLYGNLVGKSFTGDECFPRVGSFEVQVTLHNKDFQRSYGPVIVFSKIKIGMWPSTSKLSKLVDEALQKLLAEDDKACAFEKEFRKHVVGEESPARNQAAATPTKPAPAVPAKPAPAEPGSAEAGQFGGRDAQAAPAAGSPATQLELDTAAGLIQAAFTSQFEDRAAGVIQGVFADRAAARKIAAGAA